MTIDNEQEVLFPEERTAHYAGFWMRFWAYMIDMVIIFSINGLFLSPLGFFNQGLPLEIGFWTMKGLLAGIIYYAYFLLMTKFLQQTVGKMILGLKVVPHTDRELSWSDLFFREVVGRFIYNVLLILKLLYLVVAFTNEKQGLHDMIANTRVIHER
jgi:uncharacterized RDD family membrane protein YckC